ncbi:hypothetical protein ACFYUD_36270 [Nocardia tengchongensis]|uniref:hypothetical protein n=1 Tax=Nocardia tengchongensis TaxID=2055889 RepID=UPI0036C8D236
MPQPGIRQPISPNGALLPSYPGGLPQQPRVRPSAWWIAVGVLVVVMGVVGAVVTGVVGFSRIAGTVDQFQRIAIPGSGDIDLESGRDYTAYLEYSGAGESDTPEEVKVRIIDPAGEVVSTRDFDGAETYSLGGHEGRAAFSFHTTQGGTYHVLTQGGPGLTLAVGGSLDARVIGTVLIAVALGIGGLFLGIAVVVTVIVLRDRSRRRSIHGRG